MTEADPLIKASDVCRMLAISKSGLWQGINDGRFPPPLKFGPKISRWRRSDIIALVDEAERKARAA